jgi:hypothetical protein
MNLDKARMRTGTPSCGSNKVGLRARTPYSVRNLIGLQKGGVCRSSRLLDDGAAGVAFSSTDVLR